MKLGNWKGSKGAVLIFAVGVLTVLALLAAAFASITKIERNVSRNYVDSVRAKLLAQSGIERAVMEVRRSIQGTGLTPPQLLQFSAAEDESKPWLYGRPASGPPTPTAAFYHPEIPLDRAIYCSFSYNQGTGRSNTVRLADRTNMKTNPPDPAGNEGTYGNDEFGVSGFQQGTYAQKGDSYSVMVVDGGSKIYINGPDLNSTSTNPVVAAQIVKLAPNVLLSLNNLHAILNREGLLPSLSGPYGSTLGDAISNLRVANGRNFMKADEIKPIFGGSAQNQDQMFQKVKPFITAEMWMNPSTLAPIALKHPRANDPNYIYNQGWQSGMTALPNERNRRIGERTVADGPTREASCGSDRLVADDAGKWAPHWNTATNTWETPGPGVAIGPVRQPRAPVNVNTASHEVLEALFTGLTANVLIRNISSTEPRSYLGDIVSTTVSSADAQAVATAIVNRRNTLIMNRGYGFATWFDFNSFIDSLGVSKATRDIIKANANPNSHINAFNPDRAFGTRFGDVDKASLTKWTTEFSFNSNGYFEIESIGRVCGQVLANGEMPVVAEKKISTAVKVYEVYRIGTQREYVVNQASGSGVPGSIAYYPENLVDRAGQNTSAWANVAADYDGYMELPVRHSPAASGSPSFSADYVSDFGRDAVGPAEHAVSVINPATGGQPGVGNLSALFVDGYFAHMSRRYPTYANVSQYGAPFFGGVVDDYIRNARASDKIQMAAGTLVFWMKPAWDAGELPNNQTAQVSNPIAEGTRTLFSMGDGHLGYTYSNQMGPSDQSVCDNRIYVIARSGLSNRSYIFGSEATRLQNGWGWNGAIPGGPYPEQDLYYYWGAYHTNWVPMPVGAENPYDVNMAVWSPKNWGYAGNWHHIRFAWQSDSAWLFVDGRDGGADTPIKGGRAEAMKPPGDSNWSLFIQSNRFRTNSTNGYPTVGNSTISDLRISPTCNNGVLIPPPRFVAGAQYQGKIGPRNYILDAAVQNFNYAGRVANIAWTVQMPRFDTAPSCTLQVKVGSGAYQAVAPAMAPSTAYEQTGRGTPLAAMSVLPGQEVDYQVNLTGGVASPIFEDVTISVIPGAPKFLYYSIE